MVTKKKVNSKKAAKKKVVKKKVTTKKATKFPKTPGACVDAIFNLKEDIRLRRREVTALEEDLKNLSAHTQDTFSKSDLTASKTKNAQVEFVPKTKYNVDDWDKYYAYIARTKSWDLLERRPSQRAIADRLEDKKNVPGIKPYKFMFMSVTKRR